MNCTSSPTVARATTPGTAAARGRVVNFNRLTIATLLIAVAGFAGTAFAAVPIDCTAQATLSR